METNTAQGSVSLVAIGEKLKKAREGKSLTIDQVKKATRIYSDILIALEDGRGDEVLSSTYVKSFLKKYSGYLGLDSEGIAREYASITATRQNKIAPDNLLPINNIESVKREPPPQKFFYIASIIGVVLILAFAILAVSKVSTRGKKYPTAKSGLSRPGARLYTPTKTSTQTRQAPVYLVLKVKQPVLVKVKKDGVSQFERVLPKGSVESFRADNKISLYVAKAEAIELTLNGKSLGSPGRGVIKDLEITSKGIKIK